MNALVGRRLCPCPFVVSTKGGVGQVAFVEHQQPPYRVKSSTVPPPPHTKPYYLCFPGGYALRLYAETDNQVR